MHRRTQDITQLNTHSNCNLSSFSLFDGGQGSEQVGPGNVGFWGPDELGVQLLVPAQADAASFLVSFLNIKNVLINQSFFLI